jgi:regulator of replication initiation timing
MTNFYFVQDKQKMDAAAERLIHSVNAVTDLLKANTNLRENIERVQRDLEEKDAEGFQLNLENQALRERLELVEGILKANSQDYDELVS